jgi:hypothetical protein
VKGDFRSSDFPEIEGKVFVKGGVIGIRAGDLVLLVQMKIGG